MDSRNHNAPKFPAPNRSLPSTRDPAGRAGREKSPELRSTKPERNFNVCTLNCQGLSQTTKEEMLFETLEKIKWDVICLQETKRATEKRTRRRDGTEVVMGARCRNGSGGVGFAVSGKTTSAIQSMRVISSRLAHLSLMFGDVRVAIINCYAPTSSATEDEKEQFYCDLRKLYKEEKARYKIVCGDFNAKLGTRKHGEFRVGPNGYGERNEEGDRLTDFIEEIRLFHGNSFFSKPSRRKWTWRSPNGRALNEIDHFLTSNRLLLADVDVVAPFSIGGDHRLLRARLRIPRRPLRHSTRHPATLFAPDAAHAYIEHHVGLNPTYEELLNTLKEAAAVATAPGPNHMERRLSERTRDLLKTRAKLALDPSRLLELVIISRQCRAAFKHDLTKYREEILRDTAMQRRSIKIAKRGLATERSLLEALLINDQMITARPAIEEATVDFYSTLYADRLLIPRKVYTPGNVPPVLPSEVRHALSQMPKGRAPGPDNITADLLKAGGTNFHRALARLFSTHLEGTPIPDSWREARLVLLPKKGPREKLSNWRPIALLSLLYKTYSKVLLNRLKRTLEDEQPREQAGFRSGYCCADHLQTVSQVVERAREYKTPLVLTFVDFEKAFDRLDHGFLLRALEMLNVEEGYLAALSDCYDNNQLLLKLFSNELKIPVRCGVKQGDTVSPVLFTAALEVVFRQLDWSDYGLRVDGEKLNHLRFADDIVLITETTADAERMLNELNTESEKAGLRINIGKTQFIRNEQAAAGTIHLAGQAIEEVEEYIYLGRAINAKNTLTSELARRTRAGWAAFGNIKETLGTLNDKHLKANLFNTCVLPALCYGSETWAYTTTTLGRIQTAHRAMERQMLGYSLYRQRDEGLSSEDMRARSALTNPTSYMARSKHRWAGHIQRRTDGRWTRATTDWRPRNVTREPGRPPTRWADSVRNNTKLFYGRRNDYKQWATAARDRSLWRKMGSALAS